MKKWIAILMAVGAVSVSMAVEVVQNAWHYDGIADGALISTSSSTGAATAVAWGSKTWVTVQDEAQCWQANHDNKDGFLTVASSEYEGTVSGAWRLEWDYTAPDFSATEALADGQANVQMGIRRASDKKDVAIQVQYTGADNVTNIVGGVTNVVDLSEFRIQVKDESTSGGWSNMVFIAGNSISNLHLRSDFDLSTAGTFGSHVAYYTPDGGAEVAFFTGTVWSAMILDDLRIGVAGNKNKTWALGDQAYLDNIVFTQTGVPEPDPEAFGLLEEYLFDEGYQPDEKALLNTAPEPFGHGLFDFRKDWMYTSNGVLRVDAVNDGSIYGHLSLSYPSYASNKTYQLGFTLADADWSGTTNSGASMKLGIRNFSKSIDAFSIGFNKIGGNIRVIAETAGGTVNLHSFGTNVIDSAVDVRAAADFDTGLFDVYWTQNGVETLGATGLVMEAGSTTMDLGWIRYSSGFDATNGVGNAGVGDFYELDNIRFEVYDPFYDTPLGKYTSWINAYTGVIGSSTNMVDDPDSDGLENLGEWAFGGDPSDGGDLGYAPNLESMVEEGGTNYINYVYKRQRSGFAPYLNYYIQMTDSLTVGTWTNNVSKYEITGFNEDVQWRYVTNKVSTAADDALSIRTVVNFIE